MIQVSHLCKSYQKKVLLNNVFLKVRSGETKVIMGRQGSGRTLLMYLLLGLAEADQGEITIGGLRMTRRNRRQRREILKNAGVIFERDTLFSDMSVKENIAFGLREIREYRSLDDKTVREKITDALERVELKKVEDLYPDQLSPGMRKRVSLAQMLCLEPRIFFLDEPDRGVDPVSARILSQVLGQIKRTTPATMLIFSNNMRLGYDLADTVAMLYQGQIVADGALQELEHSRHPIVQQFVKGNSTGAITEHEQLTFGYVQ